MNGDSLSLLIGREALGDPLEGKWKELVVEYSYDGGPTLRTVRLDGTRLILPEDPYLLEQISRTSTTQEHERLAEVQGAPQLLVEYKPRKHGNPLEDERISFANEGPGAIKNIKVGRLRWSIENQRDIQILSAIAPLRPNQTAEHQFAAVEHKSGNAIIWQLTEILKEQMSADTEASVIVSYEDLNGKPYSRKFLLTVDLYGAIAWHPGPISVGAEAF